MNTTLNNYVQWNKTQKEKFCIFLSLIYIWYIYILCLNDPLFGGKCHPVVFKDTDFSVFFDFSPLLWDGFCFEVANPSLITSACDEALFLKGERKENLHLSRLLV